MSDPQDVVHQSHSPTDGSSRRLVRPPSQSASSSTSTTQQQGGRTYPEPPVFFPQPVVREIHKNAWLRRISPGEKKVGKRSGERWWVVFCVHDDTDAYLEFYPDPKSGVGHRPHHVLGLNSALHVSPALVGAEEFALTLTTGVVRLLAHNWDQMIEWVESLQGKLREMNIFSPKDNFYSKPPELAGKLSQRDPNSPLPPTPPTAGTSTTTTTTVVAQTVTHRPPAPSPPTVPWEAQQSSSSSAPEPISAPVPEAVNVVLPMTRAHSSDNVYEHIFTPLVISRPPPGQTPPPVLPRSDLVPKKRVQQAKAVAQQQQQQQQQRSNNNGPSTSQPNSQSSSNNGNQSLEPLEGMIGIRGGEYRIRRDEVETSNSAVIIPLKEAQVQELEREMRHVAGIKIVLRKRDLVGSVALADYQGGVWICGWKQRECPALYYAFHVGDQIIKVSGFTVHSAAEVYRLFNISSTMEVEIILRRLPHGRVWVLKRSREGEPLGLVAEGSSGEISEVIEGGLAWAVGVRGGENGVNWYLTEVNNRPLSLFSRDNEVKERLNAVGREISILLQPVTLVKQLRKGLKGLKGFKDYVVG